MLVLTRKKDQSILVGHNVRIMVVGIKQDKVRIGIDAPPDLRVDREEVRNKINREAMVADTSGEQVWYVSDGRYFRSIIIQPGSVSTKIRVLDPDYKNDFHTDNHNLYDLADRQGVYRALERHRDMINAVMFKFSTETLQ